MRYLLSPKARKILSYPIIFLASLVVSLSIYSLIADNDFVSSGVGGISIMLEYATGGKIARGIFMLIINVPLIILSIVCLGREFTTKAVLAVITISLSMVVYDKLGVPKFNARENGSEPIFAAIAAGVVGGAALAVIFKFGGASGGTDFVAAVIHKKNNYINIVWFIAAMDAIIAIVSVFVYKNGLAPAILSFIQMFINGKVCDGIMSGFKQAAKFEIITDKPDEVKCALFATVGRGVTRVPCYGMFHNKELSILMCVVRRREIPKVQQVLREFDGTFSIISETSDVYGYRFSSVVKNKSGIG